PRWTIWCSRTFFSIDASSRPFTSAPTGKRSLILTDQTGASSAASRLSFKKKILFTLILMLVAVLLALGIAEVYVRRTSKLGYVTPEILKDRSVQYVPSLFARHVFPQRELRAYGGEGPNGSLFYYINEKGYRGHNFELNKPAGKIRIIFYGGSNVF